MSSKKIGILCVLVPFVLYTAWCFATGGGFDQVSAAFLANPWTVQVSLDLVLALSIVCVWMWNDARNRGGNALPWIIATAFLGSIAPLTYLLFRPEEEVV
jgi:cytochrome bd-type quinol oxidase subunit 2